MGDDLRRDRVRDCIGEFERRIRERILAVDGSECRDLLRNSPPGVTGRNGNEAKGPAIEYIATNGQSLLKINDPDRTNRACLECELFGRNHCCGGLVFLLWVLREVGITRPATLLADPLPGAPGIYRPNWEKMEQNLELLHDAMERFFEDHLEHVDRRGEVL